MCNYTLESEVTYYSASHFHEVVSQWNNHLRQHPIAQIVSTNCLERVSFIVACSNSFFRQNMTPWKRLLKRWRWLSETTCWLEALWRRHNVLENDCGQQMTAQTGSKVSVETIWAIVRRQDPFIHKIGPPENRPKSHNHWCCDSAPAAHFHASVEETRYLECI